MFRRLSDATRQVIERAQFEAGEFGHNGALAARRGSHPSRLSPRARRALHTAFREAGRSPDRSVEPHHVLLGLLREKKGIAAHLLQRGGLDYEKVRRHVSGEQKDTA